MEEKDQNLTAGEGQEKKTTEHNSQEYTDEKKMKRRDILKSLASIPVLGVFAWGYYKKHRYESMLKKVIRDEVGMEYAPPVMSSTPSSGKKLRLGIVGFGIRGPQLMRAAGFAHPTYIDKIRKAAEKNPRDKRYQQFMEQEDLNIVFNGVCDVFDIHAKEAMETAANIERKGKEAKLPDNVKRYRTYQEMMASDDIDAVIIAAPDHWHAPITIEAARHGKHVYSEKPMTWTLEEAYAVRKEVTQAGITFQLGHQGRQTESYIKAKEAVDKNLLGKINLIEVTTNRNDPNGAWVYPIHPQASPDNIDWKQFIGQAPWHDFDLKRFFRWRCWWDYSTGLSGDLFTHEFDAINQILEMGIPQYATGSGGIYYFKDGRTVYDVQQEVFEYPDRNFSLLYSATLASNKRRGKVLMGHDGYMELGSTLNIYADPRSDRYKKLIESGKIKPERPIYSYVPGRKNLDAVTTATEQYFAGRGLLYTYRGGKRVDTTHLHIKEWLEAIRKGAQPSCNVNRGFEEAITNLMGVIAMREGRRVEWDYDKEQIVGLEPVPKELQITNLKPIEYLG